MYTCQVKYVPTSSSYVVTLYAAAADQTTQMEKIGTYNLRMDV